MIKLLVCLIGWRKLFRPTLSRSQIVLASADNAVAVDRLVGKLDSTCLCVVVAVDEDECIGRFLMN